MRKKARACALLLLGLLAFALQGCLGIGGPSTSQVTTGSGGKQINVVQDAFKGTIYATINHNLFAITGNGKSRQIIGGGNIYDPAVSPDGKKIAFVQRYKEYSNLMYASIDGSGVHMLISGNGKFLPPNSGGFVHNTYHWFFEPSWAPNGKSLLFLSDWLKLDYDVRCPGSPDTDLLDLQVFSVPLNNPNPANIQALAYTSLGGGGDRDPSYRPGHADQIVYTHYADIPSDSSKQPVQIFLADPGELARHASEYCDGGKDSGIAITSTKDQDIQPAYSPNGQSLAYVKSDSGTTSSIDVMPVPDSSVTKTPNDANTENLALQPYKQSSHLLTGTYASRPTWSPDGKQLAYLIEYNQELELWVTNLSQNAQTGAYSVQGSPIQAITGGIDGDSRFVWTS